MKGHDGKTRYCITLLVQTDQRQYTVDRWTDVPLPDDVPAIGQDVDLAVGVRAYVSHGSAMAALTWGSSLMSAGAF